MILVRHGQSEFNLVFSAIKVDPGIADPALTEEGRRQARQAVAGLAHSGIRRLIVSPYTRTLQTAAIIAEALALPVTIDPLVRERAAFDCDIGTSPGELARRFPRFAFGHLADPWWHDHVTLGVDESEADIQARAEHFRAAMAASADWAHIAVITHWGFIRALTGKPALNGEMIRMDPTLKPGDNPGTATP
jgi:glucosyl-3-phosphoglycerate phosphatase